jgi:hypothetical protein
MVQGIYVKAMLEMYNNFDGNDALGGARKRLAAVEQAVRTVAQTCQIPVPTILWQEHTGCYFEYREWRLVLDSDLVQVHIDPMRKWLLWITMPYHELRHCEQFFLMAQAMLCGAVAIPTGRRLVSPYPAFGTVASEDVLKERKGRVEKLGYPKFIVNLAGTRAVAQSAIPVARACIESLFGGGAWIRKQTYNHLSYDAGGLRESHYTPYIQLAEETDAWNVERGLRRMFQSELNAPGREDAFAGLDWLFNQ